jgi:hypothetical protein
MTIGKKRLSADHTIFVLFLAIFRKALHDREDSDEIKGEFPKYWNTVNTACISSQHHSFIYYEVWLQLQISRSTYLIRVRRPKVLLCVLRIP